MFPFFRHFRTVGNFPHPISLDVDYPHPICNYPCDTQRATLYVQEISPTILSFPCLWSHSSQMDRRRRKILGRSSSPFTLLLCRLFDLFLRKTSSDDPSVQSVFVFLVVEDRQAYHLSRDYYDKSPLISNILAHWCSLPTSLIVTIVQKTYPK